MEAAGRIAALEIDAIRDRLDVVLKPMQGLLAGPAAMPGRHCWAMDRSCWCWM